ncbi:uncharacterized protein ASCRUDRAFT_77098 [Ascoidea rubescens DSM 1968]|uniref:Uncharacterized protein n=1 Tax=Ascoidea rubescens DSM 1968 TaxID=1344418 RepID=A0A1D2VCI4_9ASCO|nr:hypothetical protein ASCRUDRAFT_77098 [Ascoidea rubescens DSM 1968]ODV59345.1 hypothetical protein ASCRUDRAFT_77098 [Ascoidea rubescens DSM 1968]
MTQYPVMSANDKDIAFFSNLSFSNFNCDYDENFLDFHQKLDENLYEINVQKQIESVPVSNQFNTINTINSLSSLNSLSPFNSINSINTLNSFNTLNSLNSLNPLSTLNPLSSLNAINSFNSLNSINSLNQAAPSSQLNTDGQINSLASLNNFSLYNPMDSINTMNSITSMTPIGSINSMNQIGTMNSLNQFSHLNQTSPLNSMIQNSQINSKNFSADLSSNLSSNFYFKDKYPSNINNFEFLINDHNLISTPTDPTISKTLYPIDIESLNTFNDLRNFNNADLENLNINTDSPINLENSLDTNYLSGYLANNYFNFDNIHSDQTTMSLGYLPTLNKQDASLYWESESFLLLNKEINDLKNKIANDLDTVGDFSMTKPSTFFEGLNDECPTMLIPTSASQVVL